MHVLKINFVFTLIQIDDDSWAVETCFEAKKIFCFS